MSVRLSALALALVSVAALPARAHEGEHTHPHADHEAGEEPPAPITEEVEVVPPAPEPEPVKTPPPPEGTADESAAATTEPTTVSRGADDGGGSSRTIPNTDWRQRMDRGRRGLSDSEWFEPAHFTVEIRFGPYFPQVDEEFGGGASPYEQFFGDEGLFYFGLEADWLPLHIPYVGSLGPGFGWGWTSASGSAVSERTGEATESETDLTIFPMHVSAVLRIDGPLRKFRIPIVPHAKVGIGFGLWTASGPSGTSDAEGVSGEGTSAGLHLALGGSIALNAFDPSAAVSMKEDTGIRYAYLWGEWMYANLDGIGSTPAMHVGTSTVVVGLGLDF